jgi:nanoRNase/pAp phosphatase (c-di-AMP/oligoRNAs hydrolase)
MTEPPSQVVPVGDASFDLTRAIAQVKGRKPALVLMHDNPDPDSMAAAEALRLLLEHVGDTRVTVGRGGVIGRAENRAMVAVLGLQHVPVSEIDFGSYQTIALVDTQPETGNNSLPPGHRVDIVVDHHPRRPAALRAPWCDVREGYGACSTIAWSYLRDYNIPITPQVATALLYAIKTETKDLCRETSDHEVEAYQALLDTADLEKLYRITEPKVAASYFAALDRALRAAEVRGPLITANLGPLGYPDLVAEVADLLLPYEHAHWVLCVGQHEGSVFLSLRTDREEPHAGHLIRAIVAGRGASGGHSLIAGGRLHAKVGSDSELAHVYHALVEGISQHLGIQVPPVRLVP